MHHTFIITANVRGSLAAGRHNLSGCTNKTCTQKHANAARRLSRSAQTHVCLLKGNFVCGCECLNVTQPFFLIVWNWDRFLPSAKKSQGESCAALLLLPVTLKCTHVHAGRHAVFKGDCSKLPSSLMCRDTQVRAHFPAHRFTPPVTVDGFIFEHSLPL